MKFRKKPVVIEAEQWVGSNLEAAQFLLMQLEAPINPCLNHQGSILIETLEGTMEARKGDWVIKGVRGELYPCKPDIFEATYEPVVE